MESHQRVHVSVLVMITTQNNDNKPTAVLSTNRRRAVDYKWRISGIRHDRTGNLLPLSVLSVVVAGQRASVLTLVV